MRRSALTGWLPSAYTLFDRLVAFRDRVAQFIAGRLRHRSAPERVRLAVEAMEERLVPDSRPLPNPFIFVGTDAVTPARVKAYAADTGTLKFSVPVFGPNYRGGVQIATADLTGDGTPDVVVGRGSGTGSEILVLDGTTGQEIAGPLGHFRAFGQNVRGGVSVATGDVNGDGMADVVVAARVGDRSVVKVFSGHDGHVVTQFVVPGAAFDAGITVASADLTGDGRAEVVVGAGGSSKVRTYDPLTGQRIAGPLGAFLAFGPGVSGGVYLGADSLSGDVNGDTKPDLVVGTGTGAARVKVFDGVTGSTLYDLKPFGAGATGGARVALAYVDDDARADIVVGSGPGRTDSVRVFSGATGQQLAAPIGSYAPFGSDAHGVAVAATNDPVPPVMTTLTAPGSAVTGQFQQMVVQIAGYSWAGVPTGTMTFTATKSGGGTYSLGTANLVSDGTGYRATATIRLASVQTGTFNVTGTWPGDANYTGGSCFSTFTVTAVGSNVPQNQARGGFSCNCVGPLLIPDGQGSSVNGISVAGVNLATGSVAVARTDLFSGGFGSPWGQIWNWTSASGYADGTAGSGATASQAPHLVQVNGDNSVAYVANASTAHFFDYYGSTYNARFDDVATMTHDTTNHVFVVKDGTGQTFTFYDFSASTPTGRAGKLSSMADANGNVTSVTSWDGSGRPTEVQRVVGSGGTAITESFLTTYVASGTNAGLVDTVTQRTKVGTGSWSTVRSVQYDYYDGTTSNGLANELRTAVVKDASGNAIDTSYYRYYTSGTGSSGKLKYAFGADAYGRLTAALGTGVDSLTDTQVSPYADKYVAYDASGRAATVVDAAAGCSACSGGLGTFTYTYATNSNATFMDPNFWVHKTVETQPDGNTTTYYTNAYGEVMLSVYTDTTTSQQWVTYYRYDAQGRVVLEAAPSAVTGFSESYNDLVNYSGGNAQYLSDSAGLVRTFTYGSSTTATTSTTGDALGYLKEADLLHGETGTAVPQESVAYLKNTAGGVDYFNVAADTVYRNDNGTGGETTTASYTYQSGTNQIASVTTTLPAVTTAENGSNSANSMTTVFDAFGRPIWTKDAAGFLTYTAYDDTTGAVVKMISDVNTANTSDFANLPSGWTTPSGGGLHHITTYEVDALGRTTKVTTPEGRVTYTVYNDANHEVRTYAGWDVTTNLPTGPTTVSREDRAHGYTETLTMSATPTVSGGRPTGTESVSGVQSLSRSYTNAVGQVTYTDDYFNLSGLTYSTAANIGTQGANYYRTQYAYDDHGQLNKTVSQQGTITRTVFDGQGRAVSEWVGTDDTPTTGYWSPTNLTGTDTVKVREYEYDGGGVGDGNVTKVTEIPGGGAANRVTQSWFDWRDRAVAVKQGVESSESTSVNRPLVYTDYDNLGEVTRTRVYDADTVTPTVTSGVPQPLSSSLLRAQTTTSYDELGRAYRTDAYSVDPSTGSVGSYTLHSDTWFDSRGNVVKLVTPGGVVTKMAYDGEGRATATYLTDGGGDSGYSDAGTLTGDTVLEQSEVSYDADGLPIATTTRQRFHDASGTGALGSPTSGIGARVSYAAAYYDKGGRTTASVGVGTNGGSAWTRPSSVPSRSDTVLVSSETYDAAGNAYEVTDPAGLVTRTLYDALGRTTTTIENYVNGVVSDTDDKTTTYAYNAAGMTSLTAHLTGGGVQTTAWVYGVTAGSGSGITSNDVVGAAQWPDPTTGAASGSQQETTTVNALGQTLTATDRNGSVHTLTYDVLGRVVSDAVTTLGSGVDGAVRRIETAYDGQGNPYLVTSYSAASGGSVVNQVQRAYNGLGQMTTEWQSHSGTVNTSTSPKVQYAYSEMAGGANHSRLTSITYPSGYVLTYNYSSGLNDGISRLSSLSDSSGTVESYDYLGLGTVVRRSHPQPGVDLTYIAASGTGDAGDKYTGLDRFGRVVDQNWDESGTSVDRYQYGYDRDSNRLYRDNAVNAAFGELYTYDGLNQLATFQRGTLNTGKTAITGTVARSQSWDVDAVGNFDGVTTNGTTQTRTANAQNEVTAISGATTPTYDANGNMTGDETGKTFVYDAWNRLVAVKSGSTTLKTYGYDGLNRRVTETASGTTTDLLYSDQWQVLEERVGSNTTKRYVWSPVYVDAMVLRDRDTNADGTLDERLWVTQDANFNVTALVNGSGTVVERYAYDTYGAATVCDASYAVRSGGTSYDWQYLHQGGRLDGVSGLYHFRNRDYSPTLGRWLSVDPLGFAAGDTNLYRYVGNGSGNSTDPSGLADWVGPGQAGWNANMANGLNGQQVHGCTVTHVLGMRENFSHTPGAGGETVGAHYHAMVQRSDGKKVEIRVWPDGTPFSQDDYDRVPKDSAGKKVERRERFDQKKNNRRGAIDGRLLAALGATAIFVGVGEYMSRYQSAGEESGQILATRVGLGRALQLLGVADMLPSGPYFSYQKHDGTIIHVNMVQKDGQWYFTAYHFEDSSYFFFNTGRVKVDDITLGQVPAYHTPNAPQLPQDLATEFSNLGGSFGLITITGKQGGYVGAGVTLTVTPSAYLYYKNTYGR